MGAPFVFFGNKRGSTCTGSGLRAELAESFAGIVVLGEFGHLAKGVADSIGSGLTSQFPNSGSSNSQLRAGKRKAPVKKDWPDCPARVPTASRSKSRWQRLA